MFLSCMKRFVLCLRHIFGVFGILFLALLIGGSIFIGGTTKTLTTMTNDIQKITSDADFTVTRVTDAVKNSLIDFLGEYHLDELGKNILNIQEDELAVDQTIKEAIEETVYNYTDYAGNVGNAIATAVGNVLLLAVIFLAIQVLSLIPGRRYVLLMEQTSVNNKGKNFIRDGICHNGLVLLSFVLLIVLIILDSDLMLLFVALYPILYCAVSLLCAKLTYDYGKKLSAGTVLRIKNILVLFGTNLLQLVIAAAIAVLCATFINWVLAVYLGAALLSIASAVVTLNADAIVLHLLEGAESKS